jgi:hypothetical protein
MTLFRKLLTKPVWWWERKRRYPIRQKHDRLPPLPVKPHPGRLAVLTTPDNFCDALWSAWSWYRLVHDKFELELVVDGVVSKPEEAAAKKLFPSVRILPAASIVSPLRQSHPVLARFFDQHPLGKKLGIILALQAERPLLYSDQDVLAFNFPTELTEGINQGVPLHLCEENAGCFDSDILDRARELGLAHAPRLNSGLLFIPQGALSLDLATQLLTKWQLPLRSWFTEQTILSVLLQQAGGVPLSREHYVVSNRRQFYWETDVVYSSIAARHFTGTTRHVMYARGLPHLLQQSLKERGNK